MPYDVLAAARLAAAAPWYHQTTHGTDYETCPICGLHEIHMEANAQLRPDSCEPCQAIAERQQGEDTDR